MAEPHQIDPQSHPITSSEGSPPPNSATTSGSSSTPTSNEGLSAGGDGKHPTASHYQPVHPPTAEGWSVSVSEGMIGQSYGNPNASSHGGQDDSEERYGASSFPSAVKLLVSNNVAGSIIGRAGQTISELQTQSAARIKLSQTGDYYPGTQDRVCLVQGEPENVKAAARLLLERLHMLQSQQHAQHAAWQQQKTGDTVAPSTSFDFVVRILVPSTSCGMIIGKAGANIKHMEESSGVSSVRLSPKESADPNNPTAAIVAGTGERVVTLTGPTVECCLKCLSIVLDGMSANHEISRYTNLTTSYSRLMVPSAYTPVQTGRPLLVVPSPTGEWQDPAAYNHMAAKRSTSQPDLTQVAMEHQRASRMGPDSPIPRDPSLQQYSPIFPDATQTYSGEMAPMMPSPARGPPSNPSTGGSPMYLFPTPGGGQMEHPNITNSSSAPDLLALQLQDTMRISNPPNPAPIDYSHFAPQMPQPTPPGFTAQVLVPDTLIGSILGRGGKTLNELQMHSNTRIRISQRGEYVPGTRNRIVTIRGPTAHSVSLAQYLMSQRMVLPPTAAYSPQGAGPFLHPSQLQPGPMAHQQQPGPHQHPQPNVAPQHHASFSSQPPQQGFPDATFLSTDPNQDSSNTAGPSLMPGSSSGPPPPQNS
ncbi:MAG: hypothetical protein SGILL_007030 [Bacillariaceae sp.]